MIQLSEHFDMKKLLRFTVPSVAMLVFISIYGVVDGFFVSNFVGKTPFAAVNLIMPFCMLFGVVGFMIGTGGSAVVSMTMGQGRMEKARSYFSLMVYTAIVLGISLSLIAELVLPRVTDLLGADLEMRPYAIEYGRWLIPFATAFIMQGVFQSFFVTAERPDLGLKVTIAAGITNMVLDYVFIVPLDLGIKGAALATGISQCVGGIYPLIWAAHRNNGSPLWLTKAKVEWRILWQTCLNGSSEMVSNMALSLVNMLYNLRLMDMVGQNGVAAYGVIMYVNFLFTSIFFGYAVGVAPPIGFHFGAQNHAELKNLFTKSIKLTAVAAVIMVTVAVSAAKPLSGIFVSYDPELHALTARGFRIFVLSFLCMGFNIFASAFFTALNNGVISAVIALMRTFVFQIGAVVLLPMIFGVDGIWCSVVTAELLGICISLYCFIRYRKRYHY